MTAWEDNSTLKYWKEQKDRLLASLDEKKKMIEDLPREIEWDWFYGIDMELSEKQRAFHKRKARALMFKLDQLRKDVEHIESEVKEFIDLRIKVAERAEKDGSNKERS